MSVLMMNTVLYYVIFGVNFLLVATILFFAVKWYVDNKAGNSTKTATDMKWILGAAALFYLIRFLAIAIFSALYNKDKAGDLQIAQFKDVFTLLQLILLAFLPSFSNTQSFIYNYQKLFTEGRKRESAINQRNAIIVGWTITILGILALQILKNKFVF